jgi:LPXTG-site transpeptidase (sortase) family protein
VLSRHNYENSLGSSAGWLEGSAFPSLNGNTIITAHVWDANNNPAPFTNLKDLQHGDQFYIHAYGQVYAYEVRDTLRVRPYKLNVLIHSVYDIVTLLTCENWSFWTGEYRYLRHPSQALLLHLLPGGRSVSCQIRNLRL